MQRRTDPRTNASASRIYTQGKVNMGLTVQLMGGMEAWFGSGNRWVMHNDGMNMGKVDAAHWICNLAQASSVNEPRWSIPLSCTVPYNLTIYTLYGPDVSVEPSVGGSRSSAASGSPRRSLEDWYLSASYESPAPTSLSTPASLFEFVSFS